MLLLLWIQLLSFVYVCAQYLVKPPPMIRVPRNWRIADTTPIGSVVGSVSTDDETDGEIVFGLERSVGFNIIESDSAPLPFEIDEKIGSVVTNQSLIDLGGNDIFMYVTAKYNDTELAAKYQVWVKIEKSNEKTKNGSPSSFPRSPNFSGTKPKTSNNPNLHSRFSSTKLGNVNNETSSLSHNTTTIKQIPARRPNGDRSTIRETVRTKNEEETTKLSTMKNTKISESDPTKEPAGKLIMALLPSIFIISCLVISGIVVAFLFRRKICKQNKIKKDRMKKESANMISLEKSMMQQKWRGTRASSNRYDSWDTDSTHNQGTTVMNLKSGDKWEIPRHHIKVFNILGEGCFGQVWKCEAFNIDHKEGTTIVAVKMLKEKAGEQERNDLLQELQVMKMLDPHPNVVRLLGCCTDRDPIFVIMEYVPHGKLQSFLRHSRAQRYYNNMHGSSNTLTSRDLTAFCYHIAKGMQYLSSKGIIHRDLAARNILVGENHTCKVADFGFARDIITSHVYERKSEGRLPIRWMAPESLYDNIFSVKSDIWSFGVLIWEIVTLGSTPYPGIPATEVMKRVRDGQRLDKPEHCRRELYNIMYYCWDTDPKERPTFGELVDLLEQLLLTETDYIQLDRFPDHSYYNMVSLSGEKL